MRWEYSVIDDFIPCFPYGQPLFANSLETSYKISLLEKLFAKTAGNYKSLESGSCRSALIDLTGCPVYTRTIPKEDSFSYNDILEEINKFQIEGSIITCGSRNKHYGALKVNGISSDSIKGTGHAFVLESLKGFPGETRIGIQKYKNDVYFRGYQELLNVNIFGKAGSI